MFNYQFVVVLAAGGLDTTLIRGGTIKGTAIRAAHVDAGSAIGHVAALDLTELRLNGGGVYAFIVEELFDFLRNLHVLRQIATTEKNTIDISSSW